MKTPLSSKSRKSLTYSIFIMIVLSIFLLGYFFYFIPKNKATINNNGFLILKTIAENIDDKSKGRLAFYKNISVKSNQEDTSVQEVLKQNNISVKSTASVKMKSGKDKSSIDSVTGNITVDGGELSYKINNTTYRDTLSFKENFTDFLESILSTQKQELFKNYALAKVNGKGPQLLYHDEDFGMRYDVKLDSLLPKNVQSYLTGIRDINSQDYDNKMFYYPFKIDTVQLVLCGFVKEDDYNAALRKVPFGFVYPLAIAFLLLLSFLPILKFYLMDSNEQIRVRDVYMFSLSVFFGVAMLTLVIIQFLLRIGEQNRVADHLKVISEQIDSTFFDELHAAYDHMVFLDSMRRMDTLLRAEKPAKTKIDYSGYIKNLLQKNSNNNNYPFDRVSWVDSTGMQVLKAEMSGQPVFTNVKDRKYFKAVQENTTYLLPDSTGKVKRFGFEPIYSWTNGDFNITISMKAAEYVIAMAVKMRSVVDVMLPAGYQYCIIDMQGNVMLHADRNRNLRENLYEKTTPANKIRQAVFARQELELSDVTMYNNQSHEMHISPLKGLPYSLVTFYDKGYITPVNLRILIFALIFFFVSAILCIVLWGVLARSGLTKHRLVYGPMDCLLWISPQRREGLYYAHGVIFLLIYLVLFIVFIALHRSYLLSNYTIFSLVLFTPVNVIAVLYSARSGLTLNNNQFETNEQKKVQRKTTWVGLVHLVVSIAFFAFSSSSGFAIGFAFMLFQALFSFWIWYYRYYRPNTPELFKKLSNHYKMGYSIIATFLVICLSVLPCGLYTWYAHNQEFIQSVKKQQLHLARNLEIRRDNILFNPVFSDSSIISPEVTNQLIFNKGLYTIYDDSASIQNDTLFNWQRNAYYNSADEDKDVSFENFYFTLADNFLGGYEDPQVYPSLPNYSGDMSWRWQVKSSKIDFFYNVPRNENVNQVIRIESVMPERFLFLNGWGLVWLIPFIVLLVYALYKWLRLNTDYVFMVKYTDTFQTAGDAKIKSFKNEFIKEHPVSDEQFEEIISDESYAKYTINTNPVDLHTYEKEILDLVAKGQAFYEFVWKKLSEKERYLLNDFAIDGLINYKNTNEIYSLLSNGVLVIAEEKMKLFSPGFRAFLVLKSETDDVVQLNKKYHQNSSWQAIKKPLLLLLLGCAVMIFFTQEAMFQKMLAVAGGLGTLISLIPKIFSGITNKPAEGNG